MNIGVNRFSGQSFAFKKNAERKNNIAKLQNNNQISSILKENSKTNFSFRNSSEDTEGFMPDFDFSRKRNIPNGHSRYEYRGGRIDIYRKNDDYRSQFTYPEDFDRADFSRHFPDLEPIIEPSADTNNTDSISNINGEIDGNTIQGATGDCWLISALYSMNSTSEGREVIKNSITVNDDSTVTVTFGGLGVSYTLSAAEIARHDTDNNTEDSYSNGDNDILVMELAVEKLWKDISRGKVQINSDNEDILYTAREGISEGGLPNQLMYYLTGVEPEEYYHEDLSDLSKNEVYEVLKNAYNSGNCALSFGVYNSIHTATLTDGTQYELNLGDGGHALAITDIQSDTLTFVNPWDTSIKYTMSWEEFANLGIGFICSSDMSNTSISDEITDMTSTTDFEYDYTPKRNINPYSDFNPYYDFDYNYEYNNNYNKNDGNSGYSSIMELLNYIISILKTITG